MVWVRKGLVLLLSLVLFFTLLDGVFAASIDIALSHPTKVEAWLNESGLYSSFVTTAIKQASSSANNDSSSSGVSLSDSAVQQAAEAAFSPSLIQGDVNTFLNSNYAWLEGKTPTPNFTIDLSSAKQSFAQQVGQKVETYLNSLPVCTPAQTEAALQSNDPLLLNCRPARLNPTASGAQVSQQLAGNNGFLGKTVITANSINPNGGSHQSEPYYKQFSYAPRIYQLATKLPWALGGLVALCMAGIVFINPSKRKGMRRIAYTLAEAGIILVAVKFASDIVFKKFENKLFNQSNNGPLQHSLTNFAQRVETQFNNVNFYFGIAMIVVAVIIAVVLISTRQRKEKPTESTPTPSAKNLPEPATPQPASLPTSPKPINSNGPASSRPTITSTRPKRPRLIQ
jgi:hypothetical protein